MLTPNDGDMTMRLTASTAPTTLDAVLAERFTCRQFTETPVPRSVIEDILRLAQRTPSWNNTQPWQVHVTSGQETDRFRAALLEHVAAAAPHPDFDFPVSYEGVPPSGVASAAGSSIRAWASSVGTRRPS